MEDPVKLIGVATGAFTIVAAFTRWLISKYFETAKQLESLKEQNTKDALAQVNHLAAGLRTDLSNLTDQLKELKCEIENIRSVIQSLKDQQSTIQRNLKPLKNKHLVRFAGDLYAFKEKE